MGSNVNMRNKLRQNSCQRRTWLNRCTPLLAMATFTGLILWVTADGKPVFAQPAPSKQKDVVKKTESDKKAKGTQVLTHPVPGAGTTVNVAALAKIIDDEIARRLKQENVKASPKADDAEFLRRVYLDLAGVIPPPEKVKAFLDSKDPNKREKIIDELLEDAQFGKHLSEIWANLLVPTDSANRLLQTESLRKWLETAFTTNKPWNQIVDELVTASGKVDENFATTFFVANPTADKMTNQVTSLFLGVQLQCAQCHNHPFTGWKQDEYWAMAAFFKGVRTSANPQMAAKKGIAITVTEQSGPGPGKGIGKKGTPEGYKAVPAKFLGAGLATIPADSPARPVLSQWLTSKDNPFFARAMANRMWGQFFGRGLVNPINDMHNDNPATHPELLMALAEQFKRHDFDLKYLVKAILMSETYQRTSKPFAGNEDDTELFSRAYVKAMSPEQLYDSIAQVVGPPKGGGFGPPGGKKGGARSPRDQFIAFFRVDEGSDPLEYQAGIPQALRLMNSAQLNNPGKALEEALKLQTPAEAIDYLYLSTVSRVPTAQESQRLVTYVGNQKDARTGYTDILWALLNSSEFTLNH
jgi:hypothetical protein